jgi:hypothetical protein
MTQSTRLVVNEAQILNHVARHRNNHFTGRITAFSLFIGLLFLLLLAELGAFFPIGHFLVMSHSFLSRVGSLVKGRLLVVHATYR